MLLLITCAWCGRTEGHTKNKKEVWRLITKFWFNLPFVVVYRVFLGDELGRLKSVAHVPFVQLITKHNH